MRKLNLLDSTQKQIIAAGLAGFVLSSTALAQNPWTSGGTSQNWSDTANWLYGVVPDTSAVIGRVVFDDPPTFYPADPTGQPNNFVNQSFTINSIKYSTPSTNGYHHTVIPAGLSLTIQGADYDPLVVSYGSPGTQLDGRTLQYRFSGGGSLVVNNPSGAIDATQPGTDADHYAILDLTGLTNFTADVQQIRVAAIAGNGIPRPMGRIILAQTNRIHTTAGVDRPGILIGAIEGDSTNLRGTQEIRLGQHNEIKSDGISIGGHKVTGTMTFQGGLTNPFVSLRGSAGGAVQVLAMGDQRAGVTTYYRPGTSVSQSGTLNTSGGLLDALVVDTYVGRSGTNSSGTSTGTLTFDQGNFTTDNLYIGYHTTGLPASGQTANAVGTVNVNGTAVLNVNNNITLSRKLGSSNPTGNLNVASNAVVNVKGNLQPDGSGNSSINNSGLIDLQPAGDVTKGNLAVGSLTGYGRITNANSVTVYSALTPGGGMAAGQMTIDGNLTFGSGGNISYNINSSPGAGNDLLKVNGNLTLVSNLVNLAPIGAILANGSYPILEYSGAINGYLRFINPTRYLADLDYSTTNKISLTVSGGSPGSVKWNSTSNTGWDTTATNWLNTAGNVPDRFFAYDSVAFDDTPGLTNLVLMSSAIYPGVVTVNSSTRNYTNGGAGRISGNASLVKQGTSMLTISNANDFTGQVSIQAGVLRTINNSALGATNSGTVIASGATLDIFGSSLYNPGEFITVSGNGHNGQGAIANSGAAQNNAIRYLSLAGDTLISTASRWDVRGPGGNGSFSGILDLNGFTLTKTGAAQYSIVDSIVTNAGTILLQQGMLGLTRSIISGPGAIRAWTNIIFLENSSTGYVAKPLEFEGGTLRVSGNPAVLSEAITNKMPGMVMDLVAGATNIMLTMSNGITGPGYVIKSNTGTAMLLAPSTYTGNTIVQAGGLKLSLGGSIANTPVITLGSLTSTGVLDVADIPGFTLSANQKLGGRGVVLGNVTAPAGAGLIPGASAGVLTFSNNLALADTESVFELGAVPSEIGVSSDHVHVLGDLNLSGLNKIKIMPLATLDTTAPYTLFQVDGTITGNLSNLQVTSDSRYEFVTSIVGKTIQVQVTGAGASANLVWKGGASGNPNTWDTSILNWLNGASADRFFQGDNVTFDDSALTTTVNVSGTLQPAAVTVDNPSKNYNWTGGSVVAGSLAKSGNGSLTVANEGVTVAGQTAISAGTVTLSSSNNVFGGPVLLTGGSLVLNPPANSVFGAQLNPLGGAAGSLTKTGDKDVTLTGDNAAYEGTITIQQGLLKLGRNTALGASNAGPTVVNGGTLDINGQSLYQFGESITITGTGLSSTGAVINTGGAQQNALSTVILAGNASVGGLNRFDVRGPGGNASFSGNLDLAGFALTKVGTNQIGVVDANVSAGVIDIHGGILAFTRCNVYSPGFINLRTNTLLLENYGVGTFDKPLVSSGGTLRLLGNAFNFLPMVTNQVGGIILDPAVALTMSGPIVGPGSVSKINTAAAILASVENNWTGGTFINGGTLQVGTGPGASDGSIPDLPIVNNGTLFYNSALNFTNSAEISGTGALNKRANTDNVPGGGILTITASNSFTGNINTGTGTSPEQGGIILLKNSYGFGSTAKRANIVRAELQLDGNISTPPEVTFATSQNADAAGWALGLVAMRNIGGNNSINGPIILTSGGGSSEFVVDAGTLSLNGNVTADSTGRDFILSGTAPGFFNGAITNNGANIPRLVKRGSNTWTLAGQSTFAGPTTVREGVLKLAATGSISNSANIDVWTNAVLDVAAVPGFAIGAGQLLRGEGIVQGAVTIDGEVQAGSGANGAEISTLSFANSLVLKGTTTLQIDRTNTPASDTIVVTGALTLGGTLVVTNLGEGLQMGDTFNLFDATSFSGSFSSYVLPALPEGMGWDTSKLGVDGTLKVGAGTSTTPIPLTYSISQNQVEFTWPADHTGWRLEAQTNAVTTGLANNWTTVPGSSSTNRVIMSIDQAAGTVFFRLVYP